MSVIKVSNLTFSYEGSYENIFENVSFQIDTDWRLGFIGRNGRGKTTFLNLLLGLHEYTGTISSSVDFEYFPYKVQNNSIYTIDLINNIYSGYEHWQLLRELSLLEVKQDVLYRPFYTLSSGEKTKVLLSILFLKENNFLLIDEPTNHLDMNARAIVSNYIKTKKGFILVSHDRSFIDNCTTHILSINKTNIEIQKGNFSSWWENKKMQDDFEYTQNEKLKKDISRLTYAAKQTGAWSEKNEKTKYATKNSGLKPDRGYIGHKSAKLMKRSKSLETRIRAAADDKAKLLKNIEVTDNLKISQLPYYSEQLAALDNVSIYYGSKTVCRNISFNICKGDKVALCGKNGSGKSSIIKLICGEDIAYSGNIIIGSRLKISYVLQDAELLSGNLDDYANQNNIDKSLFFAILRKMDFTRAQFDKDIITLSEGQKKKVLIAKSLCEKVHLHIWDEPLNFIDVFSRMQIEQLLAYYNPTILFVEHDKNFYEHIATKTVLL